MKSKRVPFDVTPGSADWWFRALDNQRIHTTRQSWIAEVSGIHSDGSDYWIQLAPVGHPERGLVLHLPQRATLDDALVALQAHVRVEAARSQVIHVTRAA